MNVKMMINQNLRGHQCLAVQNLSILVPGKGRLKNGSKKRALQNAIQMRDTGKVVLQHMLALCWKIHPQHVCAPISISNFYCRQRVDSHRSDGSGSGARPNSRGSANRDTDDKSDKDRYVSNYISFSNRK